MITGYCPRPEPNRYGYGFLSRQQSLYFGPNSDSMTFFKIATVLSILLVPLAGNAQSLRHEICEDFRAVRVSRPANIELGFRRCSIRNEAGSHQEYYYTLVGMDPGTNASKNSVLDQKEAKELAALLRNVLQKTARKGEKGERFIAATTHVELTASEHSNGQWTYALNPDRRTTQAVVIAMTTKELEELATELDK